MVRKGCTGRWSLRKHLKVVRRCLTWEGSSRWGEQHMRSREAQVWPMGWGNLREANACSAGTKGRRKQRRRGRRWEGMRGHRVAIEPDRVALTFAGRSRGIWDAGTKNSCRSFTTGEGEQRNWMLAASGYGFKRENVGEIILSESWWE